MANPEVRERRQQRHPRARVRLPVTISTIDPELDPETGKPFFRSLEETCRDVSRGGAFVLTPEPVPPGRRVLLELQLPDGSAVQAVGRVAWTRARMAADMDQSPSGIGIEFLGGAADDFSALERFVLRATRQHRAKPLAPPPSSGIAAG